MQNDLVAESTSLPVSVNADESGTYMALNIPFYFLFLAMMVPAPCINKTLVCTSCGNMRNLIELPLKVSFLT